MSLKLYQSVAEDSTPIFTNGYLFSVSVHVTSKPEIIQFTTGLHAGQSVMTVGVTFIDLFGISSG